MKRTKRTFLLSLSGMLLLGTLLFSGALVAKSLFGGSSATAPFGGSTLIAGWLLYAIAVLRA